MGRADHDPVAETFERMRDRADRVDVRFEDLRSGDPAFTAGSVLFPAGMNEWQSAVGLLAACDDVSVALGPAVLADVAIAPVGREPGQPRRGWASREDAVMRWVVTWGTSTVGQRSSPFLDADTARRAAAEPIARDPSDHALHKIVDVTPLRTDGYDRTDWLIEHPRLVDIDQPPAPVFERQRRASDVVGSPAEGT